MGLKDLEIYLGLISWERINYCYKLNRNWNETRIERETYGQ